MCIRDRYNISAQPDGRLLTVGNVLIGEQVDFAVVRVLGGQQTSQVFMPVVQGEAATGE